MTDDPPPVRYAGFWVRLAAYLLDVLPITAAVFAVLYMFLGFDEDLRRHLARDPADPAARADFLTARNRVRDLSLALYLAYCGLMEGSALRGTLGKRAVGIEVVGEDGSRLTPAQAAKRNCMKALSVMPLGLGCLWAAWSPRKQGWHDKAAGTVAVFRRTVSPAPR